MGPARACSAVLSCFLLVACGSDTGQPQRPTPSPADVATWSQLPVSPLVARHEAAGAYLDGRFYVVGGWSTLPCPPNADCSAPIDAALSDGAVVDPAAST